MSASADLICHAASPAGAVKSIRAAMLRGPDGSWRFRYEIRGNIRRLPLPTPRSPQRSDGLWQHSCFEAFLRVANADSYHEFNFAPSGDWAVYRFTVRRAGRSNPALASPRSQAHRAADRFEFQVELGPGAAAELDGADLEAGMAA